MASPWKMLYTMTWLVVVQFLLGVVRSPPLWIGLLHLALGLALIALAVVNARALQATRAPGRVKRTARSTITLASAAGLFGAALFLKLGAGVVLVAGVTVWGALLVAHLFFAVAVLAEAAAIGMSYDMWAEREFDVATTAGETPAP
ncbi:MAG: hypothetical protein ACYDCK_05270 [Thermoplasmatota archaeon]